MGCSASAPASVSSARDADVALGTMTRSTKAESKHSADRERNSRVAVARAVKRQCGYVPIFHMRSEFDAYDVDKSGALEVGELITLLADLQEHVDPELASLGIKSKDPSGAADFDTFSDWYIKVLTPHKVKALFAAYDADKNGSITREEVPALLRDLSEDSDEDACERAMKAMDANADGRVTLEEFQKYFMSTWAKDQLREAFDLYGIDADAEVDKAELREIVGRMGAELDHAAMDLMFNRLDFDKTGKVLFQTFVDYASYN